MEVQSVDIPQEDAEEVLRVILETKGAGCLSICFGVSVIRSRFADTGPLNIVQTLWKVLMCQDPLELKNQAGQTPLLVAASCQHVAVVRYLLENLHAEVNAQDAGARTSLHWAVQLNHSDLADILSVIISVQTFLTAAASKPCNLPPYTMNVASLGRARAAQPGLDDKDIQEKETYAIQAGGAKRIVPRNHEARRFVRELRVGDRIAVIAKSQ